MLSLILALYACQTTPADEDPQTSTTQRAVDNVNAGIGDAAAAPLTDLNINRKEIPELLKEIKNPYVIESELSCDDIALEVEALTGVLGRDFDVPPPDKDSLNERAADGASTAFLDAVASGASGLIPYRGIVRTLTGAERHRRKVLKAYERGSHRRTFLKGIGLAMECPVPASPTPVEEEQEAVVFK